MRIMVKRERSCEDDSKDGMRLIPDELLVSILCLLSFKEATATSIVGRRWRHLHRWTRKLDLDGTESLWNLEMSGRTEKLGIMKIGYDEEYEEERCKYIRWVDSLVAKHKSSTLEEFRIVYDLDRSHADHIDSWLRFALSRKVEKLELTFTAGGRPYEEFYTFPYKNGCEFRFMRKLCINFVNVSSEAVVSFLRNCPLLEHLSVSDSGDLSSLEIVDTFPSFRRLEIMLCSNLESVVIRDSNLVILKMDMGATNRMIQKHQFVVRNVPLLAEIWTYDDCLHLFSSVLPQIEMLKLYITRYTKEGEFVSFSWGVEMSNLKQFVVVDKSVTSKRPLLHLINLIKASHLLQRFVLESPLYCDESNAPKENIPIPLPIPRKIGVGQRMYPCLEEVKLVVNGYAARQFEMVMHFVESGVALKNIVVDPRGVSVHHLNILSWDFIHQNKINNKVLEMASALQAIVPSTINVTIL